MIPNAEKIVETIADVQNHTLDTATAVANAALNSNDHLLALTLGTWRSLIVEVANNANAIVDVKEVGELIKLETAFGWRMIDKSAESARLAFEIIGQYQQTTLGLIEPGISEFMQECVSRLEKVAGSVKPGSNLAFAAVMSALEVVRSATEGNTESSIEIAAEAPAEPHRAARKTA
ncbi:MAG TPA: phasin family protein [Aromatoleum sp.]|uniref:phasin family protein n=1 Tax=Aromatoleum sp. TaxID=2307007 RepID=UPI002B470842|nr:phasin family protein [Aromatoleum sp.]HJV24870.1 phasin family protein [Aromatoleum sp.]